MKSKKRRATIRAKELSSTQAQKDPAGSAPPPGTADLLARGRKLHEAGRLADAEIFYRDALAAQPSNANVLNLLGIVAHQMASAKLVAAPEQRGKLDEAIALYRQAIWINPNYAEAHANLGVALEHQGKLEDARESFEKAIEVAPARAATYRLLSAVKEFTAADPHITSMENMARDMTSLSPDEQIDLHFALEKAYRDLGDHKKSFYHLLEGNALKRKRIVYDEHAMLAIFDRIGAVFTSKRMRDREGRGYASSVPVFIVGMPRSGTTLVEQILASHPKVFGAGELNEFGNAVERLGNANGAMGHFPELVSSIPNDQLYQIGGNYVNAITALAPRAERIIDKMPMNFLFVGLIYLVLPNARIIHMRRDPVDTCLSCFSTLFTDRNLYSYDLGELGRYYRAYTRLMDHWRRVLPRGVMLEVNYEDVIGDLEGEARRMVSYCGLEWDDDCLSFHDTERLVRTASAAQVRQPIYKSSIGRWRAYESLLAPMIEALGVDPADKSSGAPLARVGVRHRTNAAASPAVISENEGTAGEANLRPVLGGGETQTSQILIDAIRVVMFHNGLLRIDCAAVSPNNKERPSGTLIIPGIQAAPILRSLTQAVQELDKKLREQVEKAAAARPLIEAVEDAEFAWSRSVGGTGGLSFGRSKRHSALGR
jgi:tetratricopeptide (TPR) repeat protein